MDGRWSVTSFEKFIIDCETLQQILYTNQPVPISADDLAWSHRRGWAIRTFRGADHTQSRYRDAFYSPLLSDWRNYELGEEAGAVWPHQRANAAWKQVLAEYEQPAIDPSIDEELCAFVITPPCEGSAPTDF